MIGCSASGPSETFWKTLEDANRNLSMRFEKLKKTHTTGDQEGIKQAWMEYLRTLQILYTDAQNAIAELTHDRTMST